MVTFFLFTLLLSSIGHSLAFNVTAHLGARSRNATTTTLIQQKRQNGVIVTRLSTVFLSGDPTRTRTANPGFDCRIDLSAKLWGFCPTTVIAASDCGLAGSCVDNHACSKGCGFTNQDLTTFTCKDPGNDYCSTALLTLSNRDLGAFSYIACGKAPITDSYLAFTTTVELPFDAQVTSTSTTGAPTSTSKIASETATSTSTSASSSIANAVPSASGSEGSSGNVINNGSGGGREDSGSNIGAIVGGVVGSLTVLCGSVVAIVWLLRRNRKEKALASSSSSQAERDMIDQTGGSGGDSGGATGSTSNEVKYPDIYGSERMAPTYSVQELEHNEYRGGWKPPQELAGVRSPREMADTWVRSMPVELPAGSVYWKGNSGHGNGIGNGGMI
ncbi:hypothetical protein B0T20DRAFT_116423 [Sordaria brevicollis]|uniref:Uncharacterized protein n=1 Tax=Sordaria brevicollis TaxID=83679 RepID=A0AAE0PKG1_SORBR|nr:hypothetical protein B0T20DRAFT_116423 [Sordaria brevicollis]